MWTLVEYDTYRDGGSYGATLARGEQRLSLWLEVSRGVVLPSVDILA
jgi:hypothetical protein